MRRLLVVDDNAANRLLASTILEKLGYEVASADSGEAAVAMAGETLFDVILMDINMPVLDGVASLGRIRAFPSPFCDVPVIAATAAGGAEKEKEFLRLGFDGFLGKPVSVRSLKQTIQRMFTEQKPAPDEKPSASIPADILVDKDIIKQYEDLVGEAEAATLLKSTWDGLAEEIATFRESVFKAEQETLEKQFHEFKGAAGSIGAMRLAAIAHGLMMAVKNRKVTSEEIDGFFTCADATATAFRAMDLAS